MKSNGMTSFMEFMWRGDGGKKRHLCGSVVVSALAGMCDNLHGHLLVAFVSCYSSILLAQSLIFWVILLCSWLPSVFYDSYFLPASSSSSISLNLVI